MEAGKRGQEKRKGDAPLVEVSQVGNESSVKSCAQHKRRRNSG